jgi:hypothetical protein
VVIYVFPNGSWFYDWELHGWTMEHKTTPSGGRYIDLDNLAGQHLTKEEEQAILEALGE